MYLQFRKCLDFLCLLCGSRTAFICSIIINIVTSKNWSEKYAHQATVSLFFLSVTSDLDISESPHVETLCSSLYRNSSVSPTFLWLFHVRVRRTFWTMAECTWPHAIRKVNCLLFDANGNEAVLSSQDKRLSIYSLSIFNSFTSGNLLPFFLNINCNADFTDRCM